MTQAAGKTRVCFPQTDIKVPLLNTTPMQITEYREVELVPMQSIHPYVLSSLVQEGTFNATKGEL